MPRQAAYSTDTATDTVAEGPPAKMAMTAASAPVRGALFTVAKARSSSTVTQDPKNVGCVKASHSSSQSSPTVACVAAHLHGGVFANRARFCRNAITYSASRLKLAHYEPPTGAHLRIIAVPDLSPKTTGLSAMSRQYSSTAALIPPQ